MVRAAFEGDWGVISINASFVSGLCSMAEGTKNGGNGSRDKSSDELRFPQGSEVWITVCPKFGTTAKSGLTNPEAETELPEPRRWRAVSGFPRS